VKVELANGPAPEPGSRDQVERRGSVQIVAEPAGGGGCDRRLVLADGNLVEVTAQRTGRGTMDLCAAATLATDRAAAVLGRGRVPRRGRALPARSLSNLDACALLDPAALSRVRGIDGVRPEAGFGRWDCHWHSRTGDTAIQLRFDRNGPLTAADGRPKRLGGHQAYITPGGDGRGTCLAQVVHRTYPDTSGNTTAELVFLVVSDSGSGGRLCDKAETLASAAAARLPAG
jgi:eukaryotic-like serine/threonine-protein kinase